MFVLCFYPVGFAKHSAPSSLVTFRPKEDFLLFRKFQFLVSDRTSRYFLATEINHNLRHKLIFDNPTVNSSLLIKNRMLFNEQCDYFIVAPCMLIVLSPLFVLLMHTNYYKIVKQLKSFKILIYNNYRYCGCICSHNIDNFK